MGTQHEAPSGAVHTGPGLTVSPLTGRKGLRAAGEVVLATRGRWERALEQAVGEGEDVYYLELSDVTFVDVAGAGALVAAAQRLQDGRRFVLHRPPPTLRRVLDTLWPDLSEIEVTMS
ncbi:STAS domain-containing protein [Streptomyces sp. S.PNR 29]|uniref:STAS domain-containing protein n=1 Tax=Streptomyces sp. S.PNR 29 TaxID=2973805 RepID=UPI0025B1382A|nr:STAS domain-containing protein [Streptomyces sp. S.PNR 29]MDN0194399.1 STAS domain-containing protein [Streptomyces sp. S.PNR 29]